MNVYFGTVDNFICHTPDYLTGCLFEHLKKEESYLKCPSFQDSIKNTFVIRSTYDYEIRWDSENEVIESKLYDQDFFNYNVTTRNISTGLISYLEPRIVFFAEKSLEMEVLPAFFHNTLNRHALVSGKYNIGKHFRKLETSLHLFHSDTLTIKDGDPLYYVKFLTDEKISFKKFLFNDKLEDMMRWNLQKKYYTKKIIPLNWYYENSIAKTILKEIKNNIME